jgi:hypothetical protein
MTSEGGLCVPSTGRGFAEEPNSNPNPNLNSNPGKRKRSLPGTPGKHIFISLSLSLVVCVKFLRIFFNGFSMNWSRSGCRGYSHVSKIFNGDKPIHMWNLQKGFPEGPELAASPARPQSSMEASAKNKQRSSEKGVRLSGEDLRAPRSIEGARRPHRDKEALQPEARREEVEVW